MVVADPGLGLKYAVDEPVAVRFAELPDGRIRDAVYRDDMEIRHDAVVGDFAECARRKSHLRAVLYQRQEDVALRRSADVEFRLGRQNTAFADPTLVVFFELEDADRRLLWSYLGLFAVFELSQGAAGLDELLAETIHFRLQCFIRIHATIAIFLIRNGIQSTDNISLRFILSVRFLDKLETFGMCGFYYKFCHGKNSKILNIYHDDLKKSN